MNIIRIIPTGQISAIAKESTLFEFQLIKGSNNATSASGERQQSAISQPRPAGALRREMVSMFQQNTARAENPSMAPGPSRANQFHLAN